MMQNFFLHYVAPLIKIFFMVFVFSAYASKKNELKFISVEVAPWAYQSNKNDVPVGIFPDIVQQIGFRTGFNVKVTLAPFGFSRIAREIDSGRQDCTIVILDRLLSELVVVGEKVFDHPMGVIAKKEIRLNEYRDLHGIKVSVFEALLIRDDFHEDSKIHKEFDVGYSAGLRKMKYGRVDAIAGAIPTILYLAKKEGFDDFLGSPLELKSEAIHLQCSKKSEYIKHMNSLNKVIKDMKLDGTLDKIIRDNA